MATATRTDFYYSAPGGNLTFRRTLADRLSRVRGVTTSAADIHACAGTVQAVSLLAHALSRSGASVIGLEEPAWSKLRPPLQAPGLTIRPLPVDHEGLVVHELQSGPPVDAVMVTPAHQFPTGAVMSPRRRSALLEWVRDRDVLIIEDDYDAEYNVGRHATMALQHLAPERVVYLGTTSKILSPALRLGWMVTPPWLTRKLDEMRPGFDLGISVIDQLVFAHLMSSGILDRHLRSARVHCRRRRERLIEEIGRQIPDAVVHGASAGLHVRVEFPDGCDEATVVAEAARRSVKVLSYRSFYGGRPPPGLRPTIVLGYADLTEGQIADGVGLIAESWCAACRAAKPAGTGAQPTRRSHQSWP
jgi:GntR family transcriptional regulator/MocR family aminotransferase